MRKLIVVLIVVLAVSAGLLGLYSCLRPQKLLSYHPGAIGHQTQVAQLAFRTPGGPLSFYLEYTPARTSLITFAMADDPEANTVRRDSPMSFQTSALQSLSIHQDGEWLDVIGSIEVVDPEAGLHRLVIDFPHYDSQLIAEAVWGFDQPFLDLVQQGVWVKPGADSPIEIPFVAVRHDNQRRYLFDPVPNSPAAADFHGKWSVTFSSSADPAIGVFKVGKHTSNATGTFQTAIGENGPLAGRVDGDLMRLSTFDGEHAFLYHARMQADGTIEGDFWTGDGHHETWTATRID